MQAGDRQQPLHEGALREIERSLYGKLKAHRLSDSFIERCSEDAIQKGFFEYLRARQAGAQIDNRDAFVVRAAFCRAIDELRRERRHLDGEAVEALLDTGRDAAPPSEDLALEHLAAQELQTAIAGLPAETRQMIVLHYFERMSAAQAAETLYLSERTYRRRLGRALDALRQRLGVTAPEPTSGLGFEVGLAAWTSLGGAQVAIAHGPIEQVSALASRGRDGLAWLADRLRDPLARADASGTGEKITVIAGPAGKVAGGCAAAAVACALGVVGPGIGGKDFVSLGHRGDSPPRTHRVREARPATLTPRAAQPEGPSEPIADSRPETSQPKQHRSGGSSPERKRVAKQVSGIARAGAESASASDSAQASATESAPEPVTVTPTEGGASSPEAAAKEFSFEQQP